MMFLKNDFDILGFLLCCFILDLIEFLYLLLILYYELNIVYLLFYNYDEYDMIYFYLNIILCIRLWKMFRFYVWI